MNSFLNFITSKLNMFLKKDHLYININMFQ